MSFAPSPEQLDRYADLMVNYALGGGDGIAAGDAVRVIAYESAKPLYAAVCEAIWRAGGNVLADYRPSDDGTINLSRRYYELAGPAQLDFFAADYHRGVVDQMDHLLYLHSTDQPQVLDGIDVGLILRNQRAAAPLMEWETAKETAGRYTWSIAMWGTEAMAAEAELSLEQYWSQIIAACFLDDPDPKQRWREVNRQQTLHIDALNALPIDRLHVEGPDADLWLTIGERRQWLGGGGRNIPSFEIFTSPDWRGTEGWIAFSEPLYVFGKLIRGARLRFQNGRVVEATASVNEDLLREIVATENSDKVGEFSLTDARLSPITLFMAETLYDENVGGPFGNTHLALGRALQPCYDGDGTALSERDWAELGFNESPIHTDIVSTADRTVTATLTDGSERVIYAGGQFTDATV